MARKLSNKCSELLIATQILPNLLNTYWKMWPEAWFVHCSNCFHRWNEAEESNELESNAYPWTEATLGGGTWDPRLQRGALVPGESAEAPALAKRAGEVAPAFPYFFLNPSSWLPSLTMAMGWDHIRTYAPRGLRYCFLALQTSNQELRSLSYLSPFQALSHPWSSISSLGEEEQAKTQGWEGCGKFGLDGRSEPLPWLSC